MIDEEGVPTLDDYRRGATSRWRVIVVCTLFGGLLALAFAARDRDGETWQSTVSVENDADTVLLPDIIRERSATADATLVAYTIADDVAAAIPAPVAIAVSANDDAHTLTVVGSASTAVDAEAAAMGVVTQLTEIRRAETVQQAEASRRVVDDQIAAIDAQIADRRASDAAPQTSIDNLLVERSELQGLSLTLESAAATTTGGIKSAGAPATARTDSRVAVGPLVLLGLVLGAGLGTAVALTLTFFDRSVRTRRQLQAIAPEIPTLAVLTRDVPQRTELLRVLGMRLALQSPAPTPRSVQLTTVGSTDGAARTVVDLATVLTADGRPVVVIDANTRRGRVSSLLGVGASTRLTSVSVEEPLDELAVDVPGQPLLRVVSADPSSSGEPPVIEAQVFAKLVATWASEALILVSGPGTPTSGDTITVAREVDATVLVVPFGATTDLDVSMAVSLLADAGCHVHGFVLEGVPTKQVAWASVAESPSSNDDDGGRLDR